MSNSNRRSLRLGSLVTVVVLAAAGCSSSDGDGAIGSSSAAPSPATTTTVPAAVSSPTSAPQPAGQPTTVEIVNFAFDPPTITVPVGATVTWTNGDSFAHSVVSDDDAFERSDHLDQGASFTHTFDAAGTFTYHCGIHNSMTGTVVVEG